MTNSPYHPDLVRAYTLLREGKRDEARLVLQKYVNDYPADGNGYYLSNFVFDGLPQRIKSLERALQLDSAHAEARKLLDALRIESARETLKTNTSATNQIFADQPFVDDVQEGRSRSDGTRALTIAVIVAAVLVIVIGGIALSQENFVLRPEPTAAANVIAPTRTIASTRRVPTWTPTDQPTSIATLQSNRVPDTAPFQGDPILAVDTATPDAPATDNEVQALDYYITAAAYSAATDRLVIHNGYEIILLNPQDDTRMMIELSERARSLSVSRDGLTAVVGHDKLVTTIDIVGGKIIGTHATSVNVTAAIMNDDKHIYVTGKHPDDESDVGSSIFAIRLTDSSEFKALDDEIALKIVNFYVGGDKHLYALDQEIDSIVRLDVGKDGSLTDDKYSSGEFYEVCDHVSFFDQPARALTGCGYVIELDANRSKDRVIEGTLKQNAYATRELRYLNVALVDAVDMLVAVPDPTSITISEGVQMASQLLIFDNRALNYVRFVSLPRIKDGAKRLRADALYVFAKPNSSTIYVVLKSDLTNADQTAYGLWKMEIGVR